MAAPRADVLLRIAVIFATFCVKRSCFITPDGISITLRTADVYDTNYENFINSTLWVYSKYGHLSRRNEPKFLTRVIYKHYLNNNLRNDKCNSFQNKPQLKYSGNKKIHFIYLGRLNYLNSDNRFSNRYKK